MRQSITHNHTSWVDIRNPKTNDVQYLKDNFGFHEVVLDELIPPSHRAKVENYKDYLFMVLYYPAFNRATGEIISQELDILATKTHIITSHYKIIAPLAELFAHLREDESARREYMPDGTAYLLFHIIGKILQNGSYKIDAIEKKVDYVEKEMFKGREKEMVFEISKIKRDIIDFRRILAPQVLIFESLAAEGTIFFGVEFSPYFDDLRGNFGIIWHDLQEHRENIQALAETNESLLTTKTNEVIKVLTVFSVIFLPITLLANMYGMNLERLPTAGGRIDFWLITGIMSIIVTTMFIYFRAKKWI